MAGVNKVILVGHVGKDPEVKHLEGGSTVCNFSVATSSSYKDKQGNKKEETEWHNIVLWRSLAEIAEKYLRKGQLIYIEGKLKTRSWNDKDGNKRYTTEIYGDTFTMLGKKPEDNSLEQEQNTTTQTTKSNKANSPSLEKDNDDLPF